MSQEEMLFSHNSLSIPKDMGDLDEFEDEFHSLLRYMLFLSRKKERRLCALC